jgi:UDP-N-acetylmuramoyl-tripeptide--D-alanyl-D-alanine ligase
MRPLFSAQNAVTWTGAEVEGRLPASIAGVSTDTRTLSPGDLFAALRGANFDGHSFLATAASSGAAGALVARDAEIPAAARDLPRLVVDDTLVALGKLARGHRSTFDLPAVAVTGSVGKTSTKELLAAALAPLGPVLKTEGNLNNEIGLPLTLFRLRPEHRAAVLEMGMNHAGEISRLAAIGQPTVGMVLNAREVHLEQLGTVENVARAKGELYFGLPPDGVAVANADDRLVMAQAHASGRRTLTFGQAAEGADVRLLSVDDRGLRGVELNCHAESRVWKARLSMLGAHNALNACAALAGAMACGVRIGDAIEALPAARAAPHRLELVQLPDAVTLLDDCYNASPSSMRAALETLRQGAQGRRRGAILGDMLELGPTEMELHRGVGTECGGLAWLLCFGPRSAAIADGATAAGVPEVGQVEEFDDGMAWVHRHLRAGDAVLLKGSRGMRLERFGRALGAGERGDH